MEINPLAIAPAAPKSTDVASKDVTAGFKQALADAKAVSAPEPDGPEPPPSPPPGTASQKDATPVKEEVVSPEPNAQKPQLDLTSQDSQAKVSAVVATSTDADIQIAEEPSSDEASLKDAAKTSKAAMQYLLAAMQPGAFTTPVVVPPAAASSPSAAGIPAAVRAAITTPAADAQTEPSVFDVDDLQPTVKKDESTGTKPSTQAVVDLSGLQPVATAKPAPKSSAQPSARTSPRLTNNDGEANQNVDPAAGAKPTGPKTSLDAGSATLPEAPENTTVQVVSTKDATTLQAQEATTVAPNLQTVSPKAKPSKEPVRAGMNATRSTTPGEVVELDAAGTKPSDATTATGTKKAPSETPIVEESKKTSDAAGLKPVSEAKPNVNDQTQVVTARTAATTKTDEADDDVAPIADSVSLTDAKGGVYATQANEKTPATATAKADQVKQPLSPRDTTLVVRQVADRIEMMAATRPKDGITIHLNPVDLGSITMTVKAVGSLVDTQIMASNDSVRDALDQSRPQLAAQMHSRGFQLNSVTLSSQPNNPNNMGESMTRQEQQQHQQQQHQQRSAQAEAKAFSAQYDKEASNPTPSRSIRQDRSRSLDLTI